MVVNNDNDRDDADNGADAGEDDAIVFFVCVVVNNDDNGGHRRERGGGGGKENGSVNAPISPTPTQQLAIQKGGGSDGNKEEVDVVCWRMMAEAGPMKRRR